jgi:acyl-ACP thioesterase
MSERPAIELLPVPVVGRHFMAERTVRLGDVDPDGELRLDATARYLQDVASDDALDAQIDNALGWIVRRTMIRVHEPAVVNEHLHLTTFCTGAGRSWAERRTSIVGEHGGHSEAVSLWVQLDITTGRPARLGPEFDAVWGEAAGGRVVSSKLSLPGSPSEEARSRPWAFRRADLDQFGHVNNAAHWVVLEEILQTEGVDRRGTAEMEYPAAGDVGVEMQLVVDGRSVWVVAGGRTVTAARWTPASG